MQKSKKVLLLGHFGVGKTSLIRRFVSDSFSDAYKVTIGVHISKKVVDLPNGTSLSLILWDLEGTDELNLIRNAYLMGTHGVIFVFDVTRPATFQNIQRDLDIIHEKVKKAPVIVVGNKLDLVDPADVKRLLDENSIQSDYLTSAKTGDAVNEAFLQMASQLDS
ncbi:MAG: GTP-binding protein [Eudoraea sp.]|nr:GTP-binding protein [Eudoraea sp.]